MQRLGPQVRVHEMTLSLKFHVIPVETVHVRWRLKQKTPQNIFNVLSFTLLWKNQLFFAIYKKIGVRSVWPQFWFAHKIQKVQLKEIQA